MYFGAYISREYRFAIYVQSNDLRFFRAHPEYVFYELDELKCIQEIENALSEMHLQSVTFGSRQIASTTVEVIISELDNRNLPDGFTGPFDTFRTALGITYLTRNPEFALQLMLDLK